MKIKFVKMHGCGNDYVYIDAVSDPMIENMIERPDWTTRVGRISDRHKGIGSDGVILICRPTTAAAQRHACVRMRMFNADGSEGEMCGNGVRCVAKFAHDRLRIERSPMAIETGRGVLWIQYATKAEKLVTAIVNMGSPIGELDRIPVKQDHLFRADKPYDWAINVSGRVIPVVPVSMGNPHAVTFVDDVDAFDLADIGPLIEYHPAFPNRVNFHIAEFVGKADKFGRFAELRMRTWERGSGLTQACGTGACAVHFAACRVGRLQKCGDWGSRLPIHVPGGTLLVGTSLSSERGPYSIEMEGPAEEVFEGEWVED